MQTVARWATIIVIVVAAAAGVWLLAWAAHGFSSSTSSLKASDYASLGAASATLALAAITGTLALFTGESLIAARQEIKDAEARVPAGRNVLKGELIGVTAERDHCSPSPAGAPSTCVPQRRASHSRS